ncbi:MAG TPA: hypothetical protein VGB74_07905 [Actinoplanes sp.]|jgi:hypothetical protein
MQSGGRGPRRALIIAAAAVVVLLLGASVFGVDAYAKHAICSYLEDPSTVPGGAATTEPGTPSLAEMHDAADNLRDYSRMVLFHGDLKSAATGIADDVDRMADLVDGSAGMSTKTVFTELMTIATSVNSHIRQAQRACGLPVVGVLDN